MNTASKRNPLLTIDYLQNEHEKKYFDRKSAQVRPADLAGLIVAFANAEGGGQSYSESAIRHENWKA